MICRTCALTRLALVASIVVLAATLMPWSAGASPRTDAQMFMAPICFTKAAIGHNEDVSGTTLTATFTNTTTNCFVRLGIASYNVYGLDQWDNPDVDGQSLHDSASAYLRPGETTTLSIELPTCMYQWDAFYGDVINSFAQGERYGSRLYNVGLGDAEFCASGDKGVLDTFIRLPARPSLGFW